MPKPLRIMISLLVGVAIGYILYSSLHTTQYRVEVCVDYHGQNACRVAEGRTQDLATRAAHDNACAQVTSGVTGTIGCQDTPPTSIRLLQEN